MQKWNWRKHLQKSHLAFKLLHKRIYDPLLQMQVFAAGCVSDGAQGGHLADLFLTPSSICHLVTSDTHSQMFHLPSAGPARVLRVHT